MSLVPETKVLAIASHVCPPPPQPYYTHTHTHYQVVYGYVGNTMAAFVMQSLGCDVAALNTVHFSNHTGYRQFMGSRASAQDIDDLYQGLALNRLTDFDVMLSGYAPSAAAVEAVGAIGLDLQRKAASKPGSFFWGAPPASQLPN